MNGNYTFKIYYKRYLIQFIIYYSPSFAFRYFYFIHFLTFLFVIEFRDIYYNCPY